MTLSTFNVSPAGSGNGGEQNFNTSDFLGTVPLPAQPNGSTNMELGSNSVAKVGNYSYGFFLRFVISGTLGVGATIHGARIKLYDKSSSDVATGTFTCGLTVDDSIWTLSDGFAESAYVTLSDLPRAQSHEGGEDFENLYDGNAHTFAAVPNDIGTNNSFTIATGTYSGDIEIPALLADFQGSHDDVNEAICFQLFDNTAAAIAKFFFHDSISSSGAYAPTLELDWTVPTVTTFTTSLGSAVGAKASLESRISSSATLSSAVDTSLRIN